MRTLSYIRFMEGKEKDDKGRTIEDILGWERISPKGTTFLFQKRNKE